MTACKILIVDDEQLIRMALARILSSSGFEVCIACDAIGAVSAAVKERPNLILLDLGLPAGNGMVVLQRLRNLPSTSVTPVIVITGGFVDAVQEKALHEFGCETILTKPVSAEQLLAAVRKELGDDIAPDAIHGAV